MSQIQAKDNQTEPNRTNRSEDLVTAQRTAVVVGGSWVLRAEWVEASSMGRGEEPLPSPEQNRDSGCLARGQGLEDNTGRLRKVLPSIVWLR